MKTTATTIDSRPIVEPLDLELLFTGRGVGYLNMTEDAPGFAVLAGDRIVMDPERAVRDGDQAVVELDGEGVLRMREIWRDGRRWTLKSGRAGEPDMMRDAERVRVVGVVVGVIRTV